MSPDPTGLVASAHPLASAAGVKIMKAGGNAIDAAVATSLALGVVAPAFSGIGGGGFMLVHMKGRETLYIDYRETAPRSATAGMYTLDDEGSPVDFVNSMGYRSVGVPGTVMGLAHALDSYGTMHFREVAAPAIEYARKGFEVSRFLGHIMANNVDNTYEKFRRYHETARVWTNNGRPYRAGETKINKEFADVLDIIGKEGSASFYGGSLARSLAADFSRHNGLLGMSDLSAYSIKVRKPITSTYREFEVHAMPPPSLGGLAIVQLLNIFEGLDLKGMGLNSHDAIAAMSKAFGIVWGRLKNEVGDPDFIGVDTGRLSSKEYASKLWFGQGERGNAQEAGRSNWTTHLSVADKDRNFVAITESLECYFGSGVTVPGTGFCLNDTMHDFDTRQEGVNSIAGGKRPVSSMTPTLLLKDGEPYLLAGSAGGPRIVTATLQTILNVVEHGLEIQRAVDAPRFHYQGVGPIRLESRISARVRKQLGELGFETTVPNYVQLAPGFDAYFGGVHAVMADPSGKLRGAADARRQGSVAAY